MRAIKTYQRAYRRRRSSNESSLPPRRRGLSHSAKAWLVWLVAASFVLFQFSIQLTSGEMVGGLMKSFSLSALGAGFLASSYYYVYVLLQTPAGMLMDRYGPRLLLSIGAAVMMLGSLMFASAHDLTLAVLGRVFMGGGAAFAFVGSINLISRWFPAHRFGVMTAVAETIGMMGSLAGGFFLAEMVKDFGWRDCIYAAAATALVLAVMLWTIVRNAPKNVTPITSRPKGNLIKDLREITSQKVAWINGLYVGLMFCVVTAFIALWAIPFVQVEHHLNLMDASLLCNMVFVGIAVTGPLMGWLDSHYNCRQMVLVGTAVAATILLSMMIYMPSLPIKFVGVLMFLLGAVLSSYVINYVVANEISAPHTRGTSIGFVNTLAVGTAPLLQPLIGLFLFMMNHHMHNGAAPIYTLHQYQWALTIVPLMTLVAAVLALYIPAARQGVVTE